MDYGLSAMNQPPPPIPKILNFEPCFLTILIKSLAISVVAIVC